MKKTIAITSIFAVCMLIALPLTSATESTEEIDKAFESKDIVINRLSSLRDNIKERISASRLPGNQNFSIGCLMLLFAALVWYVIALMLGEV